MSFRTVSFLDRLDFVRLSFVPGHHGREKNEGDRMFEFVDHRFECLTNPNGLVDLREETGRLAKRRRRRKMRHLFRIGRDVVDDHVHLFQLLE